MAATAVHLKQVASVPRKGYGKTTMHLHLQKLTRMPKCGGLEDDFPFEVGDV